MRRFAAFIPVMLILALVLVPSSALLAQDTTEVMTPQLTVADQGGDGTVVAIDRVAAVEDGWMVIHADEGGEPGAVLGYAAVPAGVNEGLEVTLDTPIAETGMVWAMLHVDAGEAGVYEFPGDDAPVRIGTIVVMAPLTYEVVAPEAEAEAEAEAEVAATEAVTETAEMADTAAMTETAEAEAEAVAETAEAAAETTEAAAETTEAAAETTEAAPAELPMTGANLQDAPGTLPTTGANLQDAPGTLPTTGANLQDAPGTLPTTGAGSALPAVAPALLSMLALAGVALYSRSRNK